MKRPVLLITATFLGLMAFSQETFSLKDAINYSLKNHGSNVIYNNELEKVRLQSKEALSAYLPQVNGNLTYDDNMIRQTTILPGAMFGSPKDIPVQFGNKFNSGAVVQLDQTIYDQALLFGLKAGIPSQRIAQLNIAKNNEGLIYNT